MWRSIALLAFLLVACTQDSVLTLDEARAAAEQGECAGRLTENSFYNPSTRTWWIDMNLPKEGCAPACVVYENRTSEINWRCTGLIQ